MITSRWRVRKRRRTKRPEVVRRATRPCGRRHATIQFSDDGCVLLPTRLGDSRELLGILPLNTHQDQQLRVRVAMTALPLRLPPVDVLKVAHHGSADAALPALLADLRPRIAVIEVGRRNPYGHPTPQRSPRRRPPAPRLPHRPRRDRAGQPRERSARGEHRP